MRQGLEIQVKELQETLDHETQTLTQRLRHHESQPSADDFEYARDEILRLQEDLASTKEELRCQRAGILPSSSRQGRTGSPADVLTSEQEDRQILQKVEKMTHKLESLERFAHKFMPESQHGVMEFHATIERGHQRITDIETRLAKRICARADRAQG